MYRSVFPLYGPLRDLLRWYPGGLNLPPEPAQVAHINVFT